GGDGGDGGKGGGYVKIYVYRLDNQSVIHADGQDGEGGQSAPNGYENCGAEYYEWPLHDLAGGGGAGGSGGDGGTVEIYYADLLNYGAIHANGGQGGDRGDWGRSGTTVVGHCLEYLDLIRETSYAGAPGGSGCGQGGDGGAGEHRRYECAEDGEDGEEGSNGAPGEVSTTYFPWSSCDGDVDLDGDCDHADLGALLAAWCSHEGDPNWNPCADLDCDGHVGHGDLGILLADW
ncbi:unnamed protein product, partial [marine sediment metagenome]